MCSICAWGELWKDPFWRPLNWWLQAINAETWRIKHRMRHSFRETNTYLPPTRDMLATNDACLISNELFICIFLSCRRRNKNILQKTKVGLNPTRREKLQWLATCIVLLWKWDLHGAWTILCIFKFKFAILCTWNLDPCDLLGPQIKEYEDDGRIHAFL